MAENKTSFLLYCDLIHTVRKMPKDKAGELFMHILEYVNDENPETDDLVVNIAFEPIKQALKRDLHKYQQKCDKNRDNVRKRWNKEDTTVYDRKKQDTKHTDSDNDIDKDIDSDIDTDRDKQLQAIVIKEKLFNNGTWESEKRLFLNAEEWQMKQCSFFGISKEVLEAALKRFIEKIENQDDFKSEKELKRHFHNWYPKNKDAPIVKKLTYDEENRLKALEFQARVIR